MSQKSTNHYRIVIFSFVLILLLFAPDKHYASNLNPEASKSNVLLLHSYHQGFKWTDDITHGVRSSFEDQERKIRLYVEYMDTKRIYDDTYLKYISDLFKYKFKHLRFDVVIVSDDIAFDFMKKFHELLFPGTPVVFCGVNYFRDSDIDGFDFFTGVTEEADIQAVLDLALTFHPDTKQIVIINDTTTTGIKIHEKLAKIIPWYWNRIDFQLLENVSMAEIQNRVAQLSDGALVLYTVFFRDKTGRFFETDESIQIIANHCNVPIYGLWDFSLGHGIVGGMLTSGYFQGQAAAQLALKILNGADVSSIPVLKSSPNRYMFDYRQLARFGIDIKALPVKSLIINRPFSFYRQNKNLVWGMIACLAGFSLIILTLSINIWKRKRAEKALITANQELEFRVAERTNDLSQANQQLKTEIAERILSEENRRESEEKYRNLVELANDGIIIIQNEKIQYANPRVAGLLNLPITDIIDTDFTDYVPPVERSRVSANNENRMQGESAPQIYETLLLNADANEIPVEVSAGRIPYKRHSALLVIIRDISERKKMERESLKIKRLESIGILAGGIAHDFNNILAAIMGNLELSKYISKPGHKIHTYLDEAISASLKANALTQKLVTFSKGGKALKRTMDIRPLINECVCKILDESDIEYDTTLAPDLWSSNIDEKRIGQVLQNILLNAVEARQERMRLKIIAQNILLGENSGIPLPHGKYVKIEIEDSGKGIPADQIGNIFDPYFSSKALGAQKGVGMGLAICHSVITDHEGYITASSKQKHGSIFTIYLPAAVEFPQLDRTTPPPDLIGKGKILVMDDEKMIRILAEHILNCLGYEGVTCKDGEEAIDLFREARKSGNKFDAVILDLSVPEGLGGMETIHRLKCIDADAKVIVSSGYANDPIMSEYENHGFNATLPKPYSVNKMGRVLKSVISP